MNKIINRTSRYFFIFISGYYVLAFHSCYHIRLKVSYLQFILSIFFYKKNPRSHYLFETHYISRSRSRYLRCQCNRRVSRHEAVCNNTRKYRKEKKNLIIYFFHSSCFISRKRSFQKCSSGNMETGTKMRCTVVRIIEMKYSKQVQQITSVRCQRAVSIC